MQIDPVRYEALLVAERDSKRLRSDRDEWRRKYFEMERAHSQTIDKLGDAIKRIMLLEREKDQIRSEFAAKF